LLAELLPQGQYFFVQHSLFLVRVMHYASKCITLFLLF